MARGGFPIYFLSLFIFAHTSLDVQYIVFGADRRQRTKPGTAWLAIGKWEREGWQQSAIHTFHSTTCIPRMAGDQNLDEFIAKRFSKVGEKDPNQIGTL